MSTPANPVVGMVNDPDFQKLGLSDQKRALSGIDKTFGSLSDADFTRVSQGLKGSSAPAIPGAPNGLPPVPTPSVNMQPNYATQAATTAPLQGLESGLSSPAQNPQNQQAMQTGAAIGGALTNPVATVGAIAGSIGLGKGARYGAKQLGASEHVQDIAETGGKIVGGIGGGLAGGAAEAPIMNWIKSSKSTGAKLLQQASERAGTAPVELSARTNELIDDLVQQSKLGGKPIKVISDLLERVGPSTKDAAQANPGPLTYNEARILQSNMSQLSAEEHMGLKGTQKGLLKQLAGSFSQDVQNAADKAGVGAEHAGGMREYALASSRNRVLAKIGKAGVAATGAAGLGAAGYEGYQAVKGMTP